MASSGVFVTTATAVTYKIDNQLTVHYLAFFYLEILNKNFVHKFDKQEGQYLYLVILTFIWYFISIWPLTIIENAVGLKLVPGWLVG